MRGRRTGDVLANDGLGAGVDQGDGVVEPVGDQRLGVALAHPDVVRAVADGDRVGNGPGGGVDDLDDTVLDDAIDRVRALGAGGRILPLGVVVHRAHACDGRLGDRGIDVVGGRREGRAHIHLTAHVRMDLAQEGELGADRLVELAVVDGVERGAAGRAELARVGARGAFGGDELKLGDRVIGLAHVDELHRLALVHRQLHRIVPGIFILDGHRVLRGGLGNVRARECVDVGRKGAQLGVVDLLHREGRHLGATAVAGPARDGALGTAGDIEGPLAGVDPRGAALALLAVAGTAVSAEDGFGGFRRPGTAGKRGEHKQPH